MIVKWEFLHNITHLVFVDTDKQTDNTGEGIPMRPPTTLAPPNTLTIATTYVDFRSNLTIVTAYWNLGKFQKGSGNLHFTTNTYVNWAPVFRYLVNPLVVYTDSKEFKVLMETLRFEHVHNTKIILTNRTEFWPFQLIKEIKAVF